ncbi:MAG: indole-3-glycerol phosphate synthase TrpC [Acidobacteria bacterium]|nr:MAG: indole-3-glycerol phosphate synthase TrpC [Acidobacteriota bacterium]
MDILSQIIETKKVRVASAKKVRPLAELRSDTMRLRKMSARQALRGALTQNERINIIAEFKRRSPSKGDLSRNADPVAIAKTYQLGGAVALSVLTEEDYFAGSLDDLRAVRQAISLPILRKDFIFDEYQVYESAAAGADALLLIVTALDDDTLVRLRTITEDELGMDALVEVHTSEELGRAVQAGAQVIGVNNRNLSTFEVSLETSVQLASAAPKDTFLISESGIGSADDIQRLRGLGYRGFLIGETLMRADDPEELLAQLSLGQFTPGKA